MDGGGIEGVLPTNWFSQEDFVGTALFDFTLPNLHFFTLFLPTPNLQPRKGRVSIDIERGRRTFSTDFQTPLHRLTLAIILYEVGSIFHRTIPFTLTIYHLKGPFSTRPLTYCLHPTNGVLPYPTTNTCLQPGRGGIPPTLFTHNHPTE